MNNILSCLKPLVKRKLVMEIDSPTTNMKILDSRVWGIPYAESAETWPICSKCLTPMNFVLQVNLDNDLPTVFPMKFFTLFLCCNTTFTKIYKSPSLENYVPLELPPIFIEEAVPISFTCYKSLPDWEGIKTWYPEASNLSIQANRDRPWGYYDANVEKLTGKIQQQIDGETFCSNSWLGGYPHWEIRDETPVCPQCFKKMDLFLQVDDLDICLDGGVDSCVHYLFFCQNHWSETAIVRQ